MFLPEPIRSVTIYSDSLGTVKVQKVRDHIAYDQHGNPIDSDRFKPCRQLILGGDCDLELSNEPDKSITELQQEKSDALDSIKDNSVRWELYKKFNHQI